MTDKWALARSLWSEHFAPLEANGFELERPTQEIFWKTHDELLGAHFNAETFISLAQLRTPTEVSGQARLAETRLDNPLRDYCFVRKRGRLAAAFCGNQQDASTYRMSHSNVHPDFRRGGIYRQVVRSTIAYTAALGFHRIVSDHAPGNNPVLIAKLSHGFRITGMEVDPSVGTSVLLSYFHNADHLAAYEYRCGLATMSPRILKHSHGAMSQLAGQFQEE